MLAISVVFSLLIAAASVVMSKNIVLGEESKNQFLEKSAVHAKLQELSYILATQRLTIAGVSQGKSKEGYETVDGMFVHSITNDELRVDGFTYYEKANEITLEFSVQATDGLIPINTPNSFWLKHWLKGYGISSYEQNKLVDRLIDYADEDDWTRPVGAEAFDYQQHSKSGPTNFLFQVCSELLNVDLWENYIFQHGIDLNHCSLSRSASININAMPLELIHLLWNGKYDNIYLDRASGIWLKDSGQVANSILSLNGTSDDFYTTLSSKRFIVAARANSLRETAELIIGSGEARPIIRYKR